MARPIPPHADDKHFLRKTSQKKSDTPAQYNHGRNTLNAGETLLRGTPTILNIETIHLPPPWVFGLFEGSTKTFTTSLFPTDQRRNERHTLISIRIKNARAMTEKVFQEAVRTAYEKIFQATSNRFLIRIWNFIPGILEPLGRQPQRYMVFNSARYEAYSRQYKSHDRNNLIATASGVGIQGKDMWIHALASVFRGYPVENPRQTPSYCYSTTYGPQPPCFARATFVSEPPHLLVGGTASIVGETTTHVDDLNYQMAETLLNLSAIIKAGQESQKEELKNCELISQPLSSYQHLRVYFTRPGDMERVTGFVVNKFPCAQIIEIAHADLCRKALLIEIEGLANICI